MIPPTRDTQFLYFESAEAEGKLIYDFLFVSLRIPENSYATSINCNPGDMYYGHEIWWKRLDDAWVAIDHDFIPNQLRTARLLMEGA